jgi:tRNA threonylcarbamoyl adenosine modification protein YeaZ
MQSVALAKDGRIVSRLFEGADARSADWPVKVQDLLAANGLAFCDLDRIVVGTGPGSFAGIRGALAFAQGLAIGIRAKRAWAADDPIVYGLPSALALAQENGATVVVGDARRGLFWVAVYEGAKTVAELHLVTKEELPAAVPPEAVVVTPDGARIGAVLGELFGSRFLGNRAPAAERLAQLALTHPELLIPEPLPIYLSPAVRT